MSRRDDARFDAMIHESILRGTGVLEPDEPTEYSHAVYMENWRKRLYGDFTAAERGEIRRRLGLVEAAEQ